MAFVRVSRSFDVPLDSVWQILADYGNVAEFHPGIESSRTLEDDQQGVGGMRSCEFGKGKGVDEAITAWEDGKTMRFEAVAFRKLPMKHMIGSFHFQPEPTRVTFEMDYAMKGGFPMDLMARGMMRKAGIGMLDGVAALLAKKAD